MWWLLSCHCNIEWFLILLCLAHLSHESFGVRLGG